MNAALLRTISSARLTRYLTETNNNLDEALTLYEHNTRASEAFYTPLQCLEICFRNTLDIQLNRAYGPNWHLNGNAPLNNEALQFIEEASREIGRSSSNSTGDLVAELKFAFWVSLLGPRYDATLWRQALYKGFLAGTGKKRSDVHGRLNAIRRFRNRVAHHEPILSRDLSLAHQEIIEAIGWMCRDTENWAEQQSRALVVLNEI